MHRPLAVCAALFLAGGVAAQQPTFRASTRLVEVSVVVEDGSGRPVEGLSRNDFIVYEDGVEVPIEIFAPPTSRGNAAVPAANSLRREPVAAPPEPLTRGDFSNRLGEAAAGVTVVVIDRLNTRFEDQRSVRDGLLKAIAQISPEDRAAIYVIESDAVRVLHDFTTDTASLLRALSRYQARSSRQTQAADDTPIALAAGDIPEDAAFDAWLRESTEAVSDFYIRQRVELTTRALTAIASRLASVRGRKNVVWISSAFPLVFRDRFGPQSMAASLNEAARAINNANIAVYAMNARGLVAPYAGAAAKPTEEVNRRAPGTAEADARLVGEWTPSSPQPQPNVDTMEFIAEATGGRAFGNSNDAGKAILRAVGDARLTYVLGYYPAHGNWDGAYHSIKIGVKRRGVNVRSRKGYFAIPRVASGAQPAETLLDTLRSPLESTEIGVSAHVERVEALPGKGGGEYSIEIRVEPTAITVDKAGEIWKGSLDVLIGESLPEGRYFKTFAANLQLEFSGEQRSLLLREGLRISRTVAPRPGVHRLHVVVRDAPTGTTGSLIIPLQR